MTHSFPRMTKLDVGILIAQVVVYIAYLISYYLVWGFTIICGFPIVDYSFTGLEWPSEGVIIWINGLLIIGFFNYCYFYFVKQVRKYYRIHWISNNIVIVCLIIAFIKAVIGIFSNWAPCECLDRLVFGFYLWIVSLIITIGVLSYLNTKFRRLSA